MLIQDHRKVAGLFEQFEVAKEPARKRELFVRIKDALEAHTAVEEELFYPAADKAGQKKLKDEVGEAHAEHGKMKQMLEEAEGLDPESGEFDATVAGLQGAVEHHVEEEEGELFPDARKRLTPDALASLGRQIQAREAERQGGNGARRGGRSLIGRLMRR